jgi:hypothetical protein
MGAVSDSQGEQGNTCKRLHARHGAVSITVDGEKKAAKASRDPTAGISSEGDHHVPDVWARWKTCLRVVHGKDACGHSVAVISQAESCAISTVKALYALSRGYKFTFKIRFWSSRCGPITSSNGTKRQTRHCDCDSSRYLLIDFLFSTREFERLYNYWYLARKKTAAIHPF